MFKVLGIVVAVASLSACTTQSNFVGSNPQQLAKDRAECRMITAQNFKTNSFISEGVFAQVANVKQQNASTDFYNDCMLSRGYSTQETSANQYTAPKVAEQKPLPPPVKIEEPKVVQNTNQPSKNKLSKACVYPGKYEDDTVVLKGEKMTVKMVLERNSPTCKNPKAPDLLIISN